VLTPSAGTAQHLRLARTARVAGEAFAFREQDDAPTARGFSAKFIFGGLGWAALALAALSLWFGAF